MDGWFFFIVFLGLLFDYTNGFHDAANVVSTVIATKVLAPVSAIVMAGVLNFIGATRISGVAQTIANGLVSATETSPTVILATLVGAICWNFFAWYLKIPSSSSYALVGGLLGASWAHSGVSDILWNGVFFKVLLPMMISPILGFILSFLLMKILYRCLQSKNHSPPLFRHLQIGSACFMALSHGLNDAQKSMGIITLGLFTTGFLSSTQVPLWVIMACALTIGLGTSFGGFRIIRTMAFSITKIEPIQGFAAEASTSAVILTASFMGMPVSSTQMIAGSITGVGAAKKLDAVSWKTLKKLVYSWLFTLPGAGLVGILSYLILHLYF